MSLPYFVLCHVPNYSETKLCHVPNHTETKPRHVLNHSETNPWNSEISSLYSVPSFLTPALPPPPPPPLVCKRKQVEGRKRS